jgi:hypothetical protein
LLTLSLSLVGGSSSRSWPHWEVLEEEEGVEEDLLDDRLTERERERLREESE